jgi:hypothetical protein
MQTFYDVAKMFEVKDKRIKNIHQFIQKYLKPEYISTQEDLHLQVTFINRGFCFLHSSFSKNGKCLSFYKEGSLNGVHAKVVKKT